MSENITILDAQFLDGKPRVPDLPPSDLPEVAFLGRSNVGKSTLLNRLTKRKNLARTSSTPGRTQEVNLFEVRFRTANSQEQKMLFADLPGFGYAKVAKAQRASMRQMTADYLAERKNVKAICLLNDCRRLPEEDELGLQAICAEWGLHLLVLLTKVDKLKQGERIKQSTKIAQAYHLETQDIIPVGLKDNPEKVFERLWAIVAAEL